MFNHTALKLLVPPAIEPVSVALAKSHMRISDALSDDLIAQYITAAREDCEQYTSRAIMPQTLRYSLDSFPLLPNSQYAPGNPNIVQPAVNNIWPLDPSQWAIFLPRSPVIGVSSIVYADTALTSATMPADDYIVDSDSEPARITTGTASFWPSAVFNPNAVQVTFQAGYPAPTVTVTGSAAADVYTQSSSFGGYPVYTGASTGNSIWFNCGTWTISQTVGANGSAFWVGSALSGTYVPAGTAEGSPAAVLLNTIPARFVQAMLLLISHYYEHREAVWAGPVGGTPIELPLGAKRLLNSLVIPWAW